MEIDEGLLNGVSVTGGWLVRMNVWSLEKLDRKVAHGKSLLHSFSHVYHTLTHLLAFLADKASGCSSK